MLSSVFDNAFAKINSWKFKNYKAIKWLWANPDLLKFFVISEIENILNNF